MYIPKDVQNLILSFLPTKCDWCIKDCDYEIIDYRLIIFLDEDRVEFKENSYICRSCKISNFYFDDKYLWVRNLGRNCNLYLYSTLFK